MSSVRGPCPKCRSENVVQIRTCRREVEIPIDGVRIRFMRLYLERCLDCDHITLYGKTLIGPFQKAYIPAAELVHA